MMKRTFSSAKVAIVYDWIDTKHGGAERVVSAMLKQFQHAQLFTSAINDAHATWIDTQSISTTFLQKFPTIFGSRRYLLPLMPYAFSRLNFTGYDIVISITSAHAKAIRVPKKTLHVNYLLTPPRYLWSHTYLYQAGMFAWLKKCCFHILRLRDLKDAQLPDAIIPISQLVRQRVLKYYKRAVDLPIYPLISALSTNQLSANHGFFLIVARLVSYKHIDQVILATQASEATLIIVGDGPDKKRLQKIAQQTGHAYLTVFLSDLSDTQLSEYYSACTALILPGEEDFGIAAVEALSFGKPVITLRHSGAAELLTHGKSGLILDHFTIKEITAALAKAAHTRWNPAYIRTSFQTLQATDFTLVLTDRVKKMWYR